jgi:hypothetical protein
MSEGMAPLILTPSPFVDTKLRSFLRPAFGLSSELPVCIIEVRYFYEACVYRRNNFCRDTKIVLSTASAPE